MAKEKSLIIRLDIETHKAFKRHALDVDATMQKIVENLIKDLLKKKSSKK